MSLKWIKNRIEMANYTITKRENKKGLVYLVRVQQMS